MYAHRGKCRNGRRDLSEDAAWRVCRGAERRERCQLLCRMGDVVSGVVFGVCLYVGMCAESRLKAVEEAPVRTERRQRSSKTENAKRKM